MNLDENIRKRRRTVLTAMAVVAALGMVSAVVFRLAGPGPAVLPFAFAFAVIVSTIPRVTLRHRRELYAARRNEGNTSRDRPYVPIAIGIMFLLAAATLATVTVLTDPAYPEIRFAGALFWALTGSLLIAARCATLKRLASERQG